MGMGLSMGIDYGVHYGYGFHHRNGTYHGYDDENDEKHKLPIFKAVPQLRERSSSSCFDSGFYNSSIVVVFTLAPLTLFRVLTHDRTKAELSPRT